MHRMVTRVHGPWTVIGRVQVFSGGPVESVEVEQVRLPDGTELFDYYQIRLPDFVLVYATTEEQKTLVLRQYKHGPRRVCTTFPAGAVMTGESPLAAARRELLEETGYVSDRWVSYGAYVTNANQYCNTAHLFRADACRRVSEPTAPDVENPELLALPEVELLRADVLEQIGLASHAALLAIATHPHLRSGVAV
jgi:ADP-ribose pyrophosphatase